MHVKLEACLTALHCLAILVLESSLHCGNCVFVSMEMIMSLSASAIADGADLQRYGDDTAAGGEAIDTANQEIGKAVASAPDMLVEIPRDEVSTVSTRKTEMELAATDVRTLALRCKDMPEVNREARLLRRTVSDGAKSIMSGLDSSASECQKNLLEILDAGESNLAA